MLAHLHASFNFAIYGLMNRNLRAGFSAHLSACCRRVGRSNVSSAVAAVAYGICDVKHTSARDAAGYKRKVGISRSLVAGEYHQLQATMDFVDTYRSSKRGLRIAISN